MERNDLLKSSAFWFTKIQIALYNCAENFMNKTHQNRKQLAEYLGVSKGYVTQLLSGDYNYSLEKLVDISLKLGYVPQIEFRPIEQVVEEDKQVYHSTVNKLCIWNTIEETTINIIAA